MRMIKASGLAATAILAAAFIGTTTAGATSTAICLNDTVSTTPTEAECNPPSLEHFLTVGLVTEGGVTKWVDAKATLLNPVMNITCNMLIEAHRKSAWLVTNGPVTYEGLLVYENCNCTITIIQNNGTFSFLKTGVELYEVTAIAYTLKMNCFGLIDCDYVATNLVGHGLGGLLVSGNETDPADGLPWRRGHITYNAAPVTFKEKLGVFGCPENTTMDALFQSLKRLFVRS